MIDAPTAKEIAPAATFKIRGLRWWIVGLVFLATLINFIDRLTISVLAPVITKQLGLNNLQYASITTWFLVAYAASQALSGKFYDRVGTRRGFTLSILVWASAAMAHAFARGLASLSVFRFVLGLGEAGNWPGAAKVVAEWFPARQRALGMGIFNSGVCVGFIVATPLIVWLQSQFGWRTTFLFTGGLGFGWLVLRLLLYETPERHPALTEVSSTTTRKMGWMELLKYRQVWAIVLSRFLTDPVWWLYVTWLPLYLSRVRGFSLTQIGLFAWMPYVAADAGSLMGGWASGRLIRHGWTANKARKAVIIVGAIFMSFGIPAALANNAMLALFFIGLVTFGFQSWINNVQTMPSDFFPSQAVASVAGLGGLGAGIGAILYTLTTGWVTDRFSYTPVLIVAGLLPILGTVVLLVLSGPIRPLSIESESG